MFKEFEVLSPKNHKIELGNMVGRKSPEDFVEQNIAPVEQDIENKNEEKVVDPEIEKRRALHQEIEETINKFYKNSHDYKDASDEQEKKVIFNKFIFSLEELAAQKSVSGDYYNFQRAWSQKQVDKIFEILNNNPGNEMALEMLLFRVFTTNEKKKNEDTSGRTVGDLFAKSFTNKLEGQGGVDITLQYAISNWGQNIHMVAPDVLLDMLIAVNNHPEKVDIDMRHQIIAGVGLFDSLVDTLNNRVDPSNDVVSQLKNLEILKNLETLSFDSGFQRAGHRAGDLIDQKTREKKNYFVNIRAKQIMADIRRGNQRAKWLHFKKKYINEELAETAPQSLLFENIAETKYLKERISQNSYYNQLNNEVGVIYNSVFEVDSFFDIKTNERINLDTILDREGFSPVSNSQEDLEKTKLTYKTFLSLPLREAVEKEFGLNFSDFTAREQLQFINYISSKDVSDVERIKKFIFKAHDQTDKNNRFISFLSLEADSGIGNKIIGIGEKLNDKPASADLLFAEYAKLARQAVKDADNFENLYQSIYFDKKLNRGELIKSSLSEPNRLLSSAYKNIQNLSPEESENEIKLLINDLESEITEKISNLAELKEIAVRLNEKYNNLGQDLMIALDIEEIDYKQFEEKWLSEESDWTPEIERAVKDDFVKYKKYDSNRLKEMLEYYETVLEEDAYSTSKDEKTLEDFYWEREKFQKGEISYEEFKKITKEADVIFYAPTTEEKYIYGEAISKIKSILPLQGALENKIDQIIYGHADLQLPKDFINFDSGSVKPENIPTQTPLYFPVGISKDLPSWEAVLRGDKKAAKPIDIYGYLFWLNNQNRPVNLVICDEIQTNNYQRRYNKSKTEAQEKAIEIGDQEAEQYKNIISTFNLDNIKIERYQDFLGKNKEKYGYYSGVVKNLASQPAFKEAFLAMVQESVSGAEKEEYIGYALEEVSWILSTDGTKIGHLNEARYDILATVIRSFEQVGKEKEVDVLNNPESPEAKAILNTVCKIIQDEINERKSKLEKNSPAISYFQRLQDHLKKIKTDSKTEYDKSIKKDSLSLNFVCPEVGSASFGFRGDFEAKESVIKFKEPYSTYFYKTDADLLLSSDQVVAAGEGIIGGKILTLDDKKQLKYADSVVRPILKHYFANLEKAPEEYFKKINKSREELFNEAKNATSLLSTLRFIQKYIVKPTELV